ncbi:MAG TPA: HD domain-containing protein [Actinomycetota bacterium]|nr:HD domain-containing protein [Actinomycetota bacterium]
MTGTADRFGAAREALAAAQRDGEDPLAILGSHSASVDAIVEDLFDDALLRTGRRPQGVVLVALGSYGRRELAPYSDLDLMLVHRGWTPPDVERLTRELLYPLWDAGREVGNRVRTPRETVAMLDELEETTAVLDMRLLAGDRSLFLELRSTIDRAVARARARILRSLRTADAARHARHGHAGHLLEPDIRDSRGGLRDVQSVRWMAKVVGVDPAELLAAEDAAIVDRAHRSLQRVRIQMHLRARRKVDVLYLDDQDAVAGDLGLGLGADAGDALMRDLYRGSRALASVVEDAWHRAARPRRALTRRREHALGDGCVLRDGRLHVLAAQSVADDPAGWLRAFELSSSHRVPLSRVSLARLRSSLSDGEPVWTPAALHRFLQLLHGGRRSSDALAAMDESGLLAALLPGWEHVRCLPQRNLYHRLSVDMHLLETVAQVADEREVADPELADAWSRIGDATSLVVAALLHDIGKGRGGDHSVLGSELAEEAGRRMGLPEEIVQEIAFLVREHLVLAETAVRRNLEDDVVVREMASRVGDERRLALLYLLTRADARATGPEAWSPFRASLVRELYSRVLSVLAQGRPPTPEPLGEGWAGPLSADPVAPGEVRVEVRPGDVVDELAVVARDRPGMVASVAGALALRGVDVMSADIRTLDDGVALELYRVRSAHGPVSAQRWERARSDIVRALDGALDLDAALRQKASRTRRPPRPPRPVQVSIEGSSGQAIVEVHCADSIGLLYRLAHTLHAAGCDIHSARVATYGTDAVDVFYVTGPVWTEEERRALSAKLGAAASG